MFQPIPLDPWGNPIIPLDAWGNPILPAQFQPQPMHNPFLPAVPQPRPQRKSFMDTEGGAKAVETVLKTLLEEGASLLRSHLANKNRRQD